MLHKIIKYLKLVVWPAEAQAQAGPEASPAPPRRYRWNRITLRPTLDGGPPTEIILVRNQCDVILSKYELHHN